MISSPIQPGHPAVRAEMAKVMSFWLQVGAAGFRIDAAPFVLEQVSPGAIPGGRTFRSCTGAKTPNGCAGDSVPALRGQCGPE